MPRNNATITSTYGINETQIISSNSLILPTWTPRLLGLWHENKILYVQIKGMT